MPSNSLKPNQNFHVPLWLQTVWGILKTWFHHLLGGHLLYKFWLQSGDRELALAQRARSRAPSWLRDKPNKLRLALQEYKLDTEIEQEAESNLQTLTTTTNTDHYTTVMPTVKEQFDSNLKQTSYGLRPAEQAISTPSQAEGKETQMYLGPIGDKRPTGQQKVITEKRKSSVDLPLVLIISLLMTIGLVMVYSSSIVKAGLPRNGIEGNPEFFAYNQFFFMCLGVITMMIVSKIPYQFWALTSIWWFFFGIIGLLLVYSPLGKTVNGAHRWINIGINIQPIEFVKFAWILLLCLWFGDRKQDMSLHRVIIWPLLPLAMTAALLGGQPDFGSVIIVTMIFGVTYLIAGGSFIRLLKYAAIPFLFVAVVMASKFQHIKDRLSNYQLVFNNLEDIEYNLKQALISFCSGGFSGVGLGQSSQKEYFLPEAHTDFIMTILGAEFGFLGVLTVVLLYVSFLGRCIYIARRAHDLFGALVVTMLSLILSVQAFINMSMAIGLLPTKGLTLPLISYGGSSLLITCLSLGVILNVSRGAYPGQIGIQTIILSSKLNPFPKFMKYLDNKYS